MSRPRLFGVSVDPIGMDETVDAMCRLLESGAGGQHVVLNASKVVLMDDDDRLRDIVAKAALVNADGQSIVWAGRLLGVSFPERVAGIDLMFRLFALCEARGWPVFLLGAKGEVLDVVQANLRRDYPRLVVAGAQDGYFDDDEAVGRAIGCSGARMLLVAMPSPRKEYFVAEQRAELGHVLAMGVGGSFDVYAGKVRRAPVWMQRAGLEWFHRLLQQPGGMWRRYLVGNTRFVAITLRERFSARR